MTSKSIVSWGQQGGPPEAGQGGSHHLDSGGALPVSHTRLRQFDYYCGPAEPAWLPENYLQLQITRSPSCLSSQLAEHPGASHLPSLGLQRTARRSGAWLSRKGPQCPHSQMRTLRHGGVTHSETHSGLSRLLFLGGPWAS